MININQWIGGSAPTENQNIKTENNWSQQIYRRIFQICEKYAIEFIEAK